jgi:4-amino-4-deoxy-L-arabinose transferase-like glycosyltransferase
MQNVSKYLVVAIIASLLFLPFLGQVHLFDWDEINFAECAREMIVSKDYLRAQIDFMPFWEKPPLFIWMQVLAMKMFGVGAYAARFPDAFIGVVTITTLFYAGKRVFNEKFATWWVLLYAASWLPHFYFKSGIIDPVFNYFIFMAFFQVYLAGKGDKRTVHAALSGVFLGLAVLTKGPVAILVAVLSFVVYMVVNRGLYLLKIKDLAILGLCTCIPIALWFGADVAVFGWTYGRWWVNEFITYQVRLFRTEDADHGGPFFYHFIVLLVGCFPASIFLLNFGRKKTSYNENKDFTRWMWILFWVVLILFSIVKTKIIHYSSLCYFPLTYLAALQVYRINYKNERLKKWVKGVLLSIGSVLAIAIILLPIIGLYKEKLIPLFNDPFAVANLNANVQWSYMECFWGLLYLGGLWASIIIIRTNFRRGILLLCMVQIITIQVTVLHFTPKIEAISQRAAIDYFESFKGKDVYVGVLGYKSYAHLFYTQKQPWSNPNYITTGKKDQLGHPLPPIANEDWLIHGIIDKPAYFICKIQDRHRYDTVHQLQETGDKNGFVFFKRK